MKFGAKLVSEASEIIRLVFGPDWLGSFRTWRRWGVTAGIPGG